MSENTHQNITFLLPAFTAGGAERVLITLMNGLDDDKYTKSLIVLKAEGRLEKLVADHIHVQKEPTSLKDAIALTQPDIIMTTMAAMNFKLLLLKAHFKNAKFIIREAITPSFFLQRRGWRALVSKFGYKYLYPKADLVMAPAQVMIDELQALTKLKKSQVLDNPVDINRISHKIKEGEWPAYNGGVNFVCSGRLHYQKGFDRLISALKDYESKHEWYLTILGDGKERPALEALIKANNLEDRIYLAGHVENPWAIMAAADCFLLPSRWEGLPNVVLESLSCGTRVIGMSEAGGIADIAQHTAGDDLVIVNSVAEMLKTMAQVDPLAKKEPYPPMLPGCYLKESVINKFTKIIEDVSKAN